MAFPVTHDSFTGESNAVGGVGGTTVDAAKINAFATLLEAMETEYGLSGDAGSPTGSHSARLAYLQANMATILQQTGAPGSPSTGQLWIDTDESPSRGFRRYGGASFDLLGADALTIRTRAVDLSATPSDSQALAWDAATSKIIWKTINPTGALISPMTAKGDLIYSSDASGTPARLPVGSEGGLLSVASGLPVWLASSAYIAAPNSPQQGDVLYYDGSTWVRLGPGTSGQFLKTLGPSSNPLWATPPSAAPGDGIPAPAGATQGSVLYFNGTDWVQLSPGTSGQFLKTNGSSANPAWATPSSSGFSNPMTTAGDLIYGTTGGAAARLGVGTANQVLHVASGAPAWFDPPWQTAVMTTLGDLVRGGASGVPSRVAVGSNGQVFTVVAGVPAWAAAPSGTLPSGTEGDLIYYHSGGYATLGIGSTSGFLQVVSGDPAWVVNPNFGGYLDFANISAPAASASSKARAYYNDTVKRLLMSVDGSVYAPVALDPSTTSGDVLYYGGSVLNRLGIGSTGQVLTVSGGLPAWATPATASATYLFGENLFVSPPVASGWTAFNNITGNSLTDLTVPVAALKVHRASSSANLSGYTRNGGIHSTPYTYTMCFLARIRGINTHLAGMFITDGSTKALGLMVCIDATTKIPSLQVVYFNGLNNPAAQALTGSNTPTREILPTWMGPVWIRMRDDGSNTRDCRWSYDGFINHDEQLYVAIHTSNFTATDVGLGLDVGNGQGTPEMTVLSWDVAASML